MPGTEESCCQDGIRHDAEIPPPPPPPTTPSFQTCSSGGELASSIAVPPTPSTYGWLAGSSTDTGFCPWTGVAVSCVLQSSEPLSPADEKTVWPWAAACWNR